MNYRKKYGIKHIDIRYDNNSTTVTVTTLKKEKHSKEFQGRQNAADLVLDEVPKYTEWN